MDLASPGREIGTMINRTARTRQFVPKRLLRGAVSVAYGRGSEEGYALHVDSLGIVKSRKVDLLLLDDEIVGDHDGPDGSAEEGVATEEGEEGRSRREDEPRDAAPAADQGGEERAATNIEIFWEEGGPVIGGGNGVGRDYEVGESGS